MKAKSYDTWKAQGAPSRFQQELQGGTRLLLLGHQRCSEPQHKRAVALDLLSCFCFSLDFFGNAAAQCTSQYGKPTVNCHSSLSIPCSVLGIYLILCFPFLLLLLLLLLFSSSYFVSSLFKHVPRSTAEVGARSLVQVWDI